MRQSSHLVRTLASGCKVCISTPDVITTKESQGSCGNTGVSGKYSGPLLKFHHELRFVGAARSFRATQDMPQSPG